MQAVALNVAVNSKNNVLLALLVSNNFMEVKVCERGRERRGVESSGEGGLARSPD